MAQSIVQEKMGLTSDDVILLDAQKKQIETISHEYPSGLKISFPLTEYAFQSFGPGEMWRPDIFDVARDVGVSLVIIEIPGLSPVHAAIAKNESEWTVEPYALTDKNFFASLNDPEGVYGRDLRQAFHDMMPGPANISEMMNFFKGGHRSHNGSNFSEMSQPIIFSGDGEYTDALRNVVEYTSDTIESGVFSEAALTDLLYNIKSELTSAPPKFYHDLREQVKSYFDLNHAGEQFDHKIAANMIVGSAISKRISGLGKVYNTHVINLPDMSRASVDADKEKCQSLAEMKKILTSKAFLSVCGDDAEKSETLYHIGRIMNMKYATPNVVEVCGVYGVLPRQDFKDFYNTQRAPIDIVNKPSEAVKLQSDFFAPARKFSETTKEAFTIKLSKAAMSSTLPFYREDTKNELWGNKPGLNTNEASSYLNNVQRERVKILQEAGLVGDDVMAFHVCRGVSKIYDAASNLDRNNGFSFDL